MSARFSLCDALANTLTGFNTHNIISAHTKYMKQAQIQFKQEWEQQQAKQKKRRFWQKKKKALPADELQRQYQLAYDIAMTRAQQEWDRMQLLHDRTHTIISATTTTNSTSSSTSTSQNTSQVNTPKHVNINVQ